MKLKYIIGVIFLLIQIFLIIYARFIPERFFCWAPYDEKTYLQTTVVLGDRILSKNEINDRYHYRFNGWEPRSINNVFDIIEQYENTYGFNDSSKINIKYTTNGHKMKEWSYSN